VSAIASGVGHPILAGFHPSQLARLEEIEELPTLRLRVLALIREAGERGLTDEEVQITFGCPPSSNRPRRIELLREGRVKDSGRRRPNPEGRLVPVWVATDKED
jgi:hypothetical protein